MPLLFNDLSLIQPSAAFYYSHALSGRNLPGENIHTIEVGPFVGLKSSLEANTLLLLSEIELVRCCAC